MLPKFIHDFQVCNLMIGVDHISVEFYCKNNEDNISRAVQLRDAICKEWDIVAKQDGSFSISACDLQSDFPSYEIHFDYYKPLQ